MTEAEQKEIFQQWLVRYKGLMFKVVRVYAFTPMDRDDLFQEINIQVWRSIPGFRRESAETTWIYRIALNTAIKWLKKEKRQVAAESLDYVNQILQDRDVKIDERLTWLYEEISTLDEIDRSITLLLLDNFRYKEMAVMLGMTESNVGVRINRIKKQLITRSKKYDGYGI